MNEKQAKADLAHARYYLMEAFKHLLIIDKLTYSHAMVKLLMRTPMCTVKFVAHSVPMDIDFHILFNTVTGMTRVVFPPMKLAMMGTIKICADGAIAGRERREKRNRKNVA